MKKLGWR